ncbi:hypothetical protein Leryth_014354 [Lithospermum erythrorhizon]|nr:hypothetical protein Leryth_014354 [Lithospermum erythrorhizon]
MDTKFEVLRESLVELVVVFLVLSNLEEELNALLHQVLADNLQNLVLLQSFTRNVEGEILRIHNTLHKTQVLRNQLLTVVHDEHTTNIELNVVWLLLGIKEVKWCPLRKIENSLKLQLSFNREVLHGQVLLPIIGETFVESSILFLGNFFGLPQPDWFLLVDQGPLMRHFLNLLLFLFNLLFLFINLLYLTFLVFLLFLILLFFLILIIRNLLLGSLLNPQRNGVTDEF